MKFNTERLLQVKKQILASPHEFNMTFWFSACGTTACIGGHLLALKHGNDLQRECRDMRVAMKDDSPLDTYQFHPASALFDKDLKDITAEELVISHRLFHLSNWPEDLRREYTTIGASGAETRARVAAQRIDRFIESNGQA